MLCFNNFGHIAKECRDKSMDHNRQYGKKSNKKIYIRKYEKDESINNQEKEDKISSSLSLYSFKDKDDSGCAHHMTGDKRIMESMIKNHDDNDILGTDASAKVLGPAIARTDSGGTKCMKF